MASINKVILVGNLGNDPEQRSFPGGGLIATISVATKESRKDRNSDQWTEHVEWHRVEFRNRLAEIAFQYLKKGSPVYIEGSLRTSKWIDKTTKQERYATTIRAEHLQLLGTLGSQRHSDDQSHDNAGYGDYPN